MKMWISGATTFWLVIIGAVAMVSGALIIKRALPQITQNGGELPRSLWEVKNVGGVLYVTHVLAYESSRGRPDECKPDVFPGKNDGQVSDGKIGVKKNAS